MALIRDTAHFAEHYTALESCDWPRLLPSVEYVENKFLRKQVLGKTLYDALHAAYQASITTSPTPMSGAFQALHAKCLKPIAFLAAHKAIPNLNVLFTTNGLMVSQNENMSHAPMWRTREAQSAALEMGLSFLDDLIEHLIDNEADLSDWSTAPVRTEVRESLIPSNLCTERYLRVLNGPWLLHNLRPALRNFQEGAIRNLLGDATLDALIAAVHDGTVTSDQAKLLDQARPAMLHYAIATQAPVLAITTDDNGVWTWQSTAGGGATSGGEVPADRERFNAKVRHHEQQSGVHLENLRKLVEPDEAPPDRLPDISGPFMLS